MWMWFLRYPSVAFIDLWQVLSFGSVLNLRGNVLPWELYFFAPRFVFIELINQSYPSWYDIGVIVTGATCGTGNAYYSGAPDFTFGFHICSLCPVICVFLFHVIVLSFGFWVLIVHFVWLQDISIFFTFNWSLYFNIFFSLHSH